MPSHIRSRIPIFVLAACFVLTSMSGPAALAFGCCLVDSWVEGQLLVMFEDGTPLRRVVEIADDLGSVVLDELFGELYLMSVPPGEERAYIDLFEAYDEVVYAAVDLYGCKPEDPYCDCCPMGVTCQDLPDCTRTPVTLRVGRSPGATGELTLSWTPDCGLAQFYGIYEGILGDFYSHAPKSCYDIGQSTSWDILPLPESTYYIVVPYYGPIEGSHGLDSSLAERPRPGSTCLQDQIVEHCGD